MAFFAVQGQQCRANWADSCGIAEPLPPDVPSWRILSTEYEQLCERITIDGVGHTDRQILFSHPTLEREGRTVAFALRLQGVIADIKVNATGNWSGEDTAKAMQWITLTSGGNQAAFRPQKEGVSNIEEIIRHMIGASPSFHHPQDGSLKLQRRVFTKAHEDVRREAVTLTKHEDPTGRVSQLSKDWYIDHRVKTMIRTVEGQYSAVNSYAIRRGDLVDVLTTVEIVTMKGKRGRRVEVHFSPQEVVRLETAHGIRNRMRSQQNMQKHTAQDLKMLDKESFGVQGLVEADEDQAHDMETRE